MTSLSKEEYDKNQTEQLLRTGEMVVKFTTVERLIDEFIASVYEIENNEDATEGDFFFFEALSDDYFSFELKRRIYVKALKRLHPELYDEKIDERKIRQLQKLRNVVAHRQLSTKSADVGNMQNYTYVGTEYTLESILSEFSKLHLEIYKHISSLPEVKDKKLFVHQEIDRSV